MSGEFLKAVWHAVRVLGMSYDVALLLPYRAVVELWEAHQAAEARAREEGAGERDGEAQIGD